MTTARCSDWSAAAAARRRACEGHAGRTRGSRTCVAVQTRMESTDTSLRWTSSDKLHSKQSDARLRPSRTIKAVEGWYRFRITGLVSAISSNCSAQPAGARQLIPVPLSGTGRGKSEQGRALLQAKKAAVALHDPPPDKKSITCTEQRPARQKVQ